MPDPNYETYCDPAIADYYQHLQQIQGAEAVILEELRATLATARMLDMGVGGGRTTRYFAPVVADYVGIDYADGMIQRCRRRFPEYQFEQMDGRDLGQFRDRSFDFVLFSFNGLDYVGHSDRLKILQEIHRVLQPGGYFCFSSHNLQGIEPTFSLTQQLRWNPLTTYINLVMWLLLRLKNRGITAEQLKTLDAAILRDESHNFRLAHYYIRPHHQLHQLQPWFHTLRAFAWQTGRELSTPQDLATHTEQWLYYLCQPVELSP
jgi:SAM-dependent methyltransferase